MGLKLEKGEKISLESKQSTLTIYVSKPNSTSDGSLTQEDVWGSWDIKTGNRLSQGMIIAKYNDKCPIWGDTIPYKSVTVKCKKEQENEVTYWLDFVYGCDSVKRRKEIDNDTIALRAEYQCW